MWCGLLRRSRSLVPVANQRAGAHPHAPTEAWCLLTLRGSERAATGRAPSVLAVGYRWACSPDCAAVLGRSARVAGARLPLDLAVACRRARSARGLGGTPGPLAWVGG